MKALITGAAGFVGAHLKAHLQSFGDEVLAKDSADFDIRNLEDTRTQIKLASPDVIYHLAGLSFVPQCEENFLSALDINVNGTENILRSAREFCPNATIVIISSGEVYGAVDPSKLPFKESDEINPVNNYSLSKAFAERLGMRAQSVFKQKTLIMRPFNHIGPGQNPKFVVPSFAQQLAAIKKGEKEPVLKVGNLSAKRDLTDVRDIVRGYRLAAIKGQGLYNLCSARNVSIQSVLDLLIEISGVSVKVEIDPSRLRPIDTAESRGSYDKAKRELGWEPEISLEKSLRDSFESFYNQS